jgi:HK97 family phage major capsid protein
LKPTGPPLSRPGHWLGGGASFGASGSRFGSLGEQLFAVAQAGIPGGQTDPRLFRGALSGVGETIPADGGFLVQQEYSNELVRDIYQTSLLAARCRKVQIGGNANSLVLNAFDETSRASTRFGGVLSRWTGEAAEMIASKPKFRQLTLSLKKLIGLCYASDEILADVTALEQIIRAAFVSEFGFQLDDVIINGTGAGQPLGILTSGSLVTVGKETGQRAATIVAENVVKMYSRIPPVSEASAVWLVNRNVLPQLWTMSLAVGTGGAPIFQPAGGLSGQPFNTLLGRPVVPIEQAATLGTVGDVILADLANGYILAEKGGIQTDRSIHVRFEFGESVFRFVMRVDGQPTLASALTPYKGSASDTQSFFVALATRA